MANRNLLAEHEQARKLYLQGITSPVTLAQILNLPRQTVGAWIRRGNWEALRETQAVTPLEIAQQITQILKTMIDQVKEMKADGVEISPMTIKEMVFWTRALRQLDEDYDVRGSLVQFANKYINFVSALPVEILPTQERKPFVAALQKTMPLFLKSLSE